jgi:predicted RNase H-like HicB family nuclease
VERYLFYFTKEKESYVAFSPALDLSTCGQTIEEARKNFAEVLETFFEECIKRNSFCILDVNL